MEASGDRPEFERRGRNLLECLRTLGWEFQARSLEFKLKAKGAFR